MARPIVKYLDPVSGGYEFATVVDIGDLRNLNTTIKSDIVGAINSIISDGVHNPITDERVEDLERIIDSLKDGTFEIEDFGSIDEYLKQQFLDELDKLNAQNKAEMEDVLTQLDTSVEDAIRDYQERVAAQNIILENAENTLADARDTLEAKSEELETANIGFSELEHDFNELDNYISTNVRTIDFDNFNAMVEDYETVVTQTSDEVGVDMSGSTLSYLTGRVTDAEANISAQADEITSKMGYDEFQYMPVPKYSYGENLLFDTFDFGDAWNGKNSAQVTPDTFLFGKVVAFNSPTGLYETRTDDLTIGESYVFSTYVNVQPSEKSPSEGKYEPISTSYDPTDFTVQIGGASFNPGVYEDLSGINGWVRINQEFVADVVNPIISITPTGVNSQSEIAYMAMPKLEKGLTVTPWQPHVEDNYATISSTQSMIKQQADSITAFVTEVSELDDSYKQATSTFQMLADGFAANTEAVEAYEDAVTRYGTEYSNINGKFEQKVWKDDFEAAIEDINIDNRNRVLNSDFIRNEISNEDRRLIVEDWSLSSDWEIKTIDDNKYLSRNRTGLTQNLITSASSNYFPVRSGERILFGFDLIHSGLDNDKVFAIELFDISDRRLLKEEFSLSSLTKVGNRYHGSFNISTPGAEKGSVVLQLPRNGNVSFTKISFQNADIGSVDWSPAPEDSWIIQSKLATYISQVEDEITIGGTGQKIDTLTGLLTEDSGTFTLNPDKIATEVLNSQTYDDMGFVNKTNFEQTADGWMQEITSEGRLAGYINASPDTYRISFDKILLEGTTWADALGSSKITVTDNFALIGQNGRPVLDVNNDGSINMNVTSLKIGQYDALTTDDKSDIEKEVTDNVIKTTEPYTHIAYADTEDGEGLSFDPSGKEYIGISKSHLPTPSGTPSNYTWSKWMGSSSYTHIAYGSYNEDAKLLEFVGKTNEWIKGYYGFINRNMKSIGDELSVNSLGLVGGKFVSDDPVGSYNPPSISTSEAQVLTIRGLLRAYQSEGEVEYLDMAKWLMDAYLKYYFPTASIPTTPDKNWVPHWMVNVNKPFRGREWFTDGRVQFTNGVARLSTPSVVQVYNVRDLDATMKYNFTPASDIIGKSYEIEKSVVDESNSSILITLKDKTVNGDKLVSYSTETGPIIEIGQKCESYPVWRPLEEGEIACAVDTVPWSLDTFKMMFEITKEVKWQQAYNSMKASIFEISNVSNTEYFIKYGEQNSDVLRNGVTRYSTRSPLEEFKNTGSMIEINYGATAENQEASFGTWVGNRRPLKDTEWIEVKISSDNEQQVSVYIDEDEVYDANKRWKSDFWVSGNGLGNMDIIKLPRDSFYNPSGIVWGANYGATSNGGIIASANSAVSFTDVIENNTKVTSIDFTRGDEGGWLGWAQYMFSIWGYKLPFEIKYKTNNSFDIVIEDSLGVKWRYSLPKTGTEYKTVLLTESMFTGGTEFASGDYASIILESIDEVANIKVDYVGKKTIMDKKYYSSIGLSYQKQEGLKIGLEYIKPAPSREPLPYVPYVLPFDFHLINYESTDLRGALYTGYQAPWIYQEGVFENEHLALETNLQFLKDSQDAYYDKTQIKGFFAPIFWWNYRDDFGDNEPNTFGLEGNWGEIWGGFQYRTFSDVAKVLNKAPNNEMAYEISMSFIKGVDNYWVDTNNGFPTKFDGDKAPVMDQIDSQMVANYLKGLVRLLKSDRLTYSDRELVNSQIAKSLSFLSYWYVQESSEPTMHGTWSPNVGAKEWYNFWGGEILDALGIYGMSNLEDITFSLEYFAESNAIGIYSSNDEIASKNPRDYTWSLTKGADGRTQYLHIAYANSADGIIGFDTEDSANKLYIGTYTDFEPDDSKDPSKYSWTLVKGDPGKDGVVGKDGLGIKSTTITYGVSANETTQPTTYTDAVPALVKGQYLWTKTVWVYTDNTTETGYTKTYIPKDGNDGTNGLPGKDGVGIAETAITYAKSSSGTTAPTTGYTTTVPSANPGEFIWTKTVWTYTDSTTETGYSVGKIGNTGASGKDGNPGKDGVGIQKTELHYASSTSGTTKPSTGWNPAVPSTSPGDYIWTRTTWTYTDGSKEEGYSVSRIGKDGNTGKDGNPGKDGVGIQKTVIDYATSSSGTVRPSSGWTTGVPSVTPGNYLWTRTIWTYTDGDVEEGYSVSRIGKDGSKGDDGKGIADQTITYQNHTNGTTAPTGTWSSSPSPVKGKYLWTRTVTTYTEGDPVTTYAVAYNATDGQNGSDGTGVSSTQVRYQQSTSGSTTPTGTWQTSIPAVTKGRYLWTRTIITYTDGTSSTAYSTSYYATDGTNGTNGKDGKDGTGIKSAVIAYTIHTSGTSTPTSGWVSTVPSPEKGKYMWTRTITTYTDNTTSTTYSVAYQATDGQQGDKGADGNGISSTTVSYAQTTSGTTTPTNWSSTRPAPEKGQYLWSRTIIKYTNGTSSTAYNTSYSATDGQKGDKGDKGDPGEQGPQGPQGIQGPTGSNGQSQWVHIRYSANSNGSGMTPSPSDTTKYVGIAVTNSATVPGSTEFTWSKYVGEDGEPGEPGLPGKNGKDGTTTYTWVRYADEKDGTGIDNFPDGKKFIGLAFNKSTPDETDNPNDYQWSAMYDEEAFKGIGLADKTEILSGTEIFTDKADDSVVHVEIDGESYQHAGSGKNMFIPPKVIDGTMASQQIDNRETLSPSGANEKFYEILGEPGKQYTFTFNYKHTENQEPIYLKFFYSDGTDDGKSQGALDKTAWTTTSITSQPNKTVIGIGYHNAEVEWKVGTLTESIPFSRIVINDNTKSDSESYIRKHGVNGSNTYSVEYKWVNGVKTSETRNKKLTSTVSPVNEEYVQGTMVVEWKTETYSEPIKFSRTTIDDKNVLPADSYIRKDGVDGSNTYSIEYKWVNGVKTSETKNKKLVSTKNPVNEEYVRGTMVVEWKKETSTETIPFTRETQNSSDIYPSESYISREGVNGSITYSFERKWVNGASTNETRNKVEKSRENAVNEIYIRGTKTSEWKQVTTYETIPYTTIRQNDNTIEIGTELVDTVGKDGRIKVITEHEYVNNSPTGEKREVSRVTDINMIPEVIKVGTKPKALVNLLEPSKIKATNALDIQIGGNRKPVQSVDSLDIPLELWQWAANPALNIEGDAIQPGKEYTFAFKYEIKEGLVQNMFSTSNVPWWNNKAYMDGELVSTRADGDVPDTLWPKTPGVHTFVYQFGPAQESVSKLFMFRFNENHYTGSVKVWLTDIGLYEGHVQPFGEAEAPEVPEEPESPEETGLIPFRLEPDVTPSTTKTTIDAFANKKTYNLVTDFGAVGDGVTDNFTAIKQAILSSVSEPVNIVVPEGNFYYRGPDNARLEVWPNKSQGIRFIGQEGSVLLPDHNRTQTVHESYTMQLVFDEETSIGFAMEGLTIDGINAPQDIYHTMPNATNVTVPTLRGISIEGAQDIVIHNSTFKNIFGGYTILATKYKQVDLSYVELDRCGGNAWTESFGGALYFGGQYGDATINIDNVHAEGYTDSRYPKLLGWIGIIFENGSVQLDNQSSWVKDQNTYFNITNSSFLNYETGWHVETVAGNTYWNSDNVLYKVNNYAIVAALWGEIKEASNRIKTQLLPFGRTGIISGMYYSEKEASKNENGLNNFNMYNSYVDVIDVPGFPSIRQTMSYGDSVHGKYYNTTFNNVPNGLVTNGSATVVNSEINLSPSNPKTDYQLKNGEFNKPTIQKVSLTNTNINRGTAKIAAKGSNPAKVKNTGYTPPPLTKPLGPATLERES